MGRLPLVPGDTADPAVRPIFEAVLARGRSVGLESVPAIYRTLGNAPAVLKAWTDLAWRLRSESTSPLALRELIALRVGLLTGTSYLWHHHRAAALESGVRPSQMRSLARWEESDEFDARERAGLRCTDEITRDLVVSDEAFADLARHFSPAQVVELTVTAAFFSCAARVILSLEIDVSPEFLVEDVPGR